MKNSAQHKKDEIAKPEQDRANSLRLEYEQRLRQLEQRLQAVVDISSDFFWELDANHRIALVRGPAVDKAGFDSAQLIGKTHWDLPTVVPISDGGTWEKLKALLAERQPFEDFVYRFLTIRGEQRYVSINGQPAFDASGGFVGYRGITKDITHRFQVDRRMTLQQNVARILAGANDVGEAINQILRTVCETLGWACGARWVLDEATKTLRSVETWGLALPEIDEFLLAGKNLSALALSGDGLVRRTATGKEPLWIRNVTKEASFVRAGYAAKAGLRSAFAFAIRVDGKAIGVMEFYCRDAAHEADRELLSGAAQLGVAIGQFCQRKQTKQQLERFRAAMDMSADEIYLVDRETLRFLDVNETACKATGYTREEMLKIGPPDLWANAYDFNKLYDDVIACGAAGMTTEGIGTGKGGVRQRPIEAHRRALQLDGRTVIVTISRDIGDRKRNEQARLRSSQMYAALSATNEAILHAKSPEDMFQRVCAAAVDGGKFHTLAVVLPEANGAAKVVAAAGPGAQSARASGVSFDAARAEGQGLVGNAFRTQTSVISDDFIADARTQLWHESGQKHGVASAAAVPLTRHGHALGVLLFCSSEKQAFDAEIVTLIERMAENIAFALENFGSEHDRELAEQARLRVSTMYAVLGATNEAILRATSVEDLYQRVCDAAVQGGKFVSAAIVVPDPGSPWAKIAASSGRGGGRLRKTRLSLDASVPEGRAAMGLAFNSKKSVAVNDYLNDERTKIWHEGARAAGIASNAAVPLLRNGSAVGVLLFYSTEKHAFDEEIIKLFERMAENIAFALDNFERALQRKQTEEELLRFRAVIDTAPDQVFFVDPEKMRFIYVNDKNSSLSGYSADEYMNMNPAQIAGQEPEKLKRLYDDIIAKAGEGMYQEVMYHGKDGRMGWFEVHRRAVRMGDKWIIVNMSREITARKLAERSAMWQSRMYATLGATNEAIMHGQSAQDLYERVCNAAVTGGKFLTAAVLLPEPDSRRMTVTAAVGAGVEQLRGARISTDESQLEGSGLVGSAFRTLKPSVSNDFMKDERMRSWHALAEQAGVKAGAAVPLIHGSRTVGVLLLHSNEKRAFSNEVVTLLERMAENISFALDNFDREAERKRGEERIQYLANHDGLTGLPNRVMFSQLLNGAIQSAQRYQRKFAVLFIDLDRFKVINDTLGHEAGDQLLQESAKRLRESLRASDAVARLGGDEFVILVQEISDAEQAAVVARKVLSTVIRPMMLAGQECRVTASIGIAMYPGDGEDEHQLMKNADIAMYHAKEEGKNNFQFHSSQAQSQSLERLTLESNLRRALERNEFSLHYQAKLDLKTNAITGVEALLRWQNPQLGNVSPAQFIPLAEETGMIVPIGKWVLDTACRQNVEWQRQGLPPLRMAVNLSARQFSDEHLLSDIASALKESGMAAELLELEITEGMVIHNPQRAVETLTAIKRMGARLAIDDFGTGYSSLGQLKNFPIDTLKVDRSFIREIPQDAEDKAITEAIIAMGKTLSLTVVAEGVETEAQAQFLREHACDEMQGYYFSKPIAAEQFAALFQHHLQSPKADAS